MVGQTASKAIDPNQIRYTIEGVSDLIGVPVRTIERWVRETRHAHDGSVAMKGVLGERDPDKRFSFVELIELLYVKELIRPRSGGKGFKLAEVVRAAEMLSKVLGDYPFARANLGVVGGQIVSQSGVAKDTATNVVLMQHLLDFEKDLVTSIEFEDGFPTAWYPTPDHTVVVRPGYRFGQPTTSRSRVPTAAIYRRYVAESQDVESTAEWFEITPDEVDDAVRFEERLGRRKVA